MCVRWSSKKSTWQSGRGAVRNSHDFTRLCERTRARMCVCMCMRMRVHVCACGRARVRDDGGVWNCVGGPQMGCCMVR